MDFGHLLHDPATGTVIASAVIPGLTTTP